MIMTLMSTMPATSSRYQILYNGKLHESSSVRYNEVGCISFIDESSYPSQQYTFCNNFLVMSK